MKNNNNMYSNVIWEMSGRMVKFMFLVNFIFVRFWWDPFSISSLRRYHWQTKLFIPFLLSVINVKFEFMAMSRENANYDNPLHVIFAPIPRYPVCFPPSSTTTPELLLFSLRWKME